MSMHVWYMSGLGRLMSLRYRMSRSQSRGRYTRPSGAEKSEHVDAIFWITVCASVCALQWIVVMSVLRRCANTWRIIIALPQPSGPTRMNGWHWSASGCSIISLRCTEIVETTAENGSFSSRSAGGPLAFAKLLNALELSSNQQSSGFAGSGQRSPDQPKSSFASSVRSARPRLPPSPRMSPHTNAPCVVTPWIAVRPFMTVPTSVVSTTMSRRSTNSSARWK